MYPLRVRSSSASIATTGNWMFNFLLAFCTPIVTDKIGYKYGYVFCVCNLMAFIIVFFFYYESSNLTLEQVDMMYNDPTCKPWRSPSWIAPGTACRGGPIMSEQELKEFNAAKAKDQLNNSGSSSDSTIDNDKTSVA